MKINFESAIILKYYILESHILKKILDSWLFLVLSLVGLNFHNNTAVELLDFCVVK